MRNYVIFSIRHKGFKPRYYNPNKGKVILAYHVARYFGVKICRMLRGYPSVPDTWSTREPLFEIGVCTEAMPKDAMLDRNRCMHFTDDWTEDDAEDWGAVYNDPKVESPETSRHRIKFCLIEDGFNDAWMKHIILGKYITFDESRIVGWYSSAITMWPEPKSIRTGATVHSMCVTFGPLATYMLKVRTYGGKTDEDLNKKSRNIGTVQKFVNLLDMFLDDFKGRGCHVTCDLAYTYG